MTGGDSESATATNERRASLSRLPKWAPADLIEWLDRIGVHLPARLWNRYIHLITDPRMREVWNWYSRVMGNATHELYATGLSFCMNVDRALSLPGKPGNMTKAKRTEYFEQVRKHTHALIKLLEGTRYSSNAATYSGRETGDIIDNKNLGQTVVRDLEHWGVEEQGHVVAYYVDIEGVSRLPWNYPESELLDLLWDIIDWTHDDDGWDWRLGSASSKPLEYSKVPSMKVVYFTCTLYRLLARGGMQIPFPHLATVTNVALDLPAADEVDEDTVRKQVRRYEARYGREKAQAKGVF